MTEKELLHKRERKRDRRQDRNNTKIPKRIKVSRERRRGLERTLQLIQSERKLDKELKHLERVQFGIKQLKRFGEPLIEESKQREIERNIVPSDLEPKHPRSV